MKKSSPIIIKKMKLPDDIAHIYPDRCSAPYCRRKLRYKVKKRGISYFYDGYCEIHTWMYHLEWDFNMKIPWGRGRFRNLA